MGQKDDNVQSICRYEFDKKKYDKQSKHTTLILYYLSSFHMHRLG